MDKLGKRRRRNKKTKREHLQDGSFLSAETLDGGLHFDDYLLWWERLQSVELYQKIWKEMGGKEKTEDFGQPEVHAIILLLLKWLRQPPSNSKTKWGLSKGGSLTKAAKAHYKVAFAHQIVNTLEFLVFFCPHDIAKDKTLSWEIAEIWKVIKKSEGTEKTDGATLLSRSFVRQCIAGLFEESQGKRSSKYSRLVLNCSYVYSNEMDGTRISDERDLPPKVRFTVSGDTPFAFRFIKNALKGGGGGPSGTTPAPARMLDTCIGMLLSTNLPQQLKTLPPVAKSTFLALVHMLKEFLRMRPVANVEYLFTVYKMMEPYTRWPLPYGDVAADFRAFVRTEADSPGAAFRRRLRDEIPVLNVPASAALGVVPEGTTDQETLDKVKMWNHAGSSATVFYDTDTFPGQHRCLPDVYAFLLELDPTYPGPEDRAFEANGCNSNVERAHRAIIVQIVGAYYEGIDEDVLGLKTLGGAYVSKISAGLQALVNTELMPTEAYHGVGVPSCTFEEIVNVATIRAEAVGRFVQQHVPKAAPLIKRALPNKLGGDGDAPPSADLAASAKPPFPHQDTLSLICHGFPEESTERGKSTVHHLDWSEGSGCCFAEYRKRLRTLFRRAAFPLHHGRTFGDGAAVVRSPLKIALLGGQMTIHRFLCAYAGLLEETPFETLDKYVELRLYLLPVSHSDVGAHLAAKDGWYRRQVFSAYRMLHLSALPGLKLNLPLDQLKKICQLPTGLCVSLKSPPPMLLPRNLLEDYIQSAKEVFSLPVFECLCWASEEDDVRDGLRQGSANPSVTVEPREFDGEAAPKGPQETTASASAHVTIPCFSRVEIGNNVHVHQFQRGNSEEWKEKERETDKGMARPKPRMHRGSSVSVAMEAFQESQTWRNVMKSKAFRANWNRSLDPELTLSFREVDVNGNVRPLSVDNAFKDRKAMPYAHISILNIPAYKGNMDIGEDPCVPGMLDLPQNARAPFMGLTATPLKGPVLDLLKKKELRSKETEQILNLFNGRSSDGGMPSKSNTDGGEDMFKNLNVSNAAGGMIEDTETCYHDVGFVEIAANGLASKKTNASSATPKFKVLIDGVLYGPFVKIIVRPKKAGRSQQLRLPFMHFLPMEE